MAKSPSISTPWTADSNTKTVTRKSPRAPAMCPSTTWANSPPSFPRLRRFNGSDPRIASGSAAPWRARWISTRFTNLWILPTRWTTVLCFSLLLLMFNRPNPEGSIYVFMMCCLAGLACGSGPSALRWDYLWKFLKSCPLKNRGFGNSDPTWEEEIHSDFYPLFAE